DPADVLTVDEVEEPTIGDGDVLIEVDAASVNPADWHLVRATPAIARLSTGLRRPSFDIPGCDVAGRVVATGAAVTTVRPGAEVTGVCSTRNLDLAASLGAAHVTDYTTEDVTAGGPYDVILQLAGTTPASTLRRSLTRRGRLLQLSGDSRNRLIGPLGRILAGR